METIPTFRSRLCAPLPEGWLVKDSITLIAPDGRANVIVSSEPIEPVISTQHYAQIQGQLLRSEFPGYREAVFKPIELLGGRQGYIRRFEWSPPDSEPVTQIQVYYTETGRGYTATATSPSTEIQRFELDLSLILGGLTISQP